MVERKSYDYQKLKDGLRNLPYKTGKLISTTAGKLFGVLGLTGLGGSIGATVGGGTLGGLGSLLGAAGTTVGNAVLGTSITSSIGGTIGSLGVGAVTVAGAGAIVGGVAGALGAGYLGRKYGGKMAGWSYDQLTNFINRSSEKLSPRAKDIIKSTGERIKHSREQGMKTAQDTNTINQQKREFDRMKTQLEKYIIMTQAQDIISDDINELQGIMNKHIKEINKDTSSALPFIKPAVATLVAGKQYRIHIKSNRHTANTLDPDDYIVCTYNGISFSPETLISEGYNLQDFEDKINEIFDNIRTTSYKLQNTTIDLNNPEGIKAWRTTIDNLAIESNKVKEYTKKLKMFDRHPELNHIFAGKEYNQKNTEDKEDIGGGGDTSTDEETTGGTEKESTTAKETIDTTPIATATIENTIANIFDKMNEILTTDIKDSELLTPELIKVKNKQPLTGDDRMNLYVSLGIEDIDTKEFTATSFEKIGTYLVNKAIKLAKGIGKAERKLIYYKVLFKYLHPDKFHGNDKEVEVTTKITQYLTSKKSDFRID